MPPCIWLSEWFSSTTTRSLVTARDGARPPASEAAKPGGLTDGAPQPRIRHPDAARATTSRTERNAHTLIRTSRAVRVGTPCATPGCPSLSHPAPRMAWMDDTCEADAGGQWLRRTARSAV